MTEEIKSEQAEVENSVLPRSARKPTRGRGGNANFPAAKVGMDPKLVSKAIAEALVHYKKPRVQNDQELAQRFQEYFEHCQVTGQMPLVEEMLMSSGWSVAYMQDIAGGRRRGFSETTAHIIKKAKEFMSIIDARMAVEGKLNFLTYCFRAKNYYGMQDRVEVAAYTGLEDAAARSAEDIARRYMTGPESVEGEIVEDADR